ncbi:MAG: histidinol-phosphatase [Clostridia bacterium]|nr:histidinol-phosphatase [Clostridia bacterium]
MIANYHTHSYHCRHAGGKPEEYVLTAIKNGLSELGFSDHVPCPFSNGHTSGFRMYVNETETYVNEILELREKYEDKIKIYVGYEAEYYPKEFEGMLGNIRKYPLDFIICGQHFLRNEYDGPYSGAPDNSPEKLAEYVDQVSEAMSTGVFTYVCHPDLINFTGEESVYRKEIVRLCEASVRYGVPLEYNCLGLEGHRHYPRDLFWKIVAESGADTVIGSDAHVPDRVAHPEVTALAEDKMRRFGLVPLQRVSFKDPN